MQFRCTPPYSATAVDLCTWKKRIALTLDDRCLDIIAEFRQASDCDARGEHVSWPCAESSVPQGSPKNAGPRVSTGSSGPLTLDGEIVDLSRPLPWFVRCVENCGPWAAWSESSIRSYCSFKPVCALTSPSIRKAARILIWSWTVPRRAQKLNSKIEPRTTPEKEQYSVNWWANGGRTGSSTFDRVCQNSIN